MAYEFAGLDRDGRGLSAVRVDSHIIQLPHLETKAPSSEATGESQSLSRAYTVIRNTWLSTFDVPINMRNWRTTEEGQVLLRE